MSYADKALTCRDCRQAFVFSAGEQEFFASKGFTNEPSRCPECRSTRRSERSGGSYTSGGYSTGGYSSGGYSSGGGRRDREMYSVVCSSCGNNAQVPFQPRGDKPVYCSDCFAKQRGTSTGGYGGGRGYR
ncbi:MAG: zinc-ribbon domain containing protein [Chloroflexota bacterium]